MTWDGKERREHQRYGVKRLGIQYSKSRMLSFLSNYSEKYLVLNISEGGMYFMTKEDLNVGQAVSFRIDSTRGQDSPIKGVAEVSWKTKSQEHAAWKVGARFTKVGARSLGRIRELIDGSVLDKVDVSTSIYLREVERL